MPRAKSFLDLKIIINKEFKNFGINFHLIPEPKVKKSWIKKFLEKLLAVVVWGSFLNLFLHVLSEVYFCVTHFNKEYIVATATCTMLLMSSSFCFQACYMEHLHRLNFRKLILKCERFHNPTDPIVKKVTAKKAQNALEHSLLVVRGLFWLAVAGIIVMIFGGLFFDHFIEKSEYPLPFISVIPITNKVTYVLMFVHHVLATTTATNGLCLCAVLLFVNFIYIFAQFEALEEIIGLQKHIEYEHWKKLVTEGLTDIKLHLTSLLNITEIFFFYMGKLVFVIFFTSWIIFHTRPAMFGYATACLAIVVVLFIMVIINEKFADRFADLNKAIWGLEWYCMPPKDRKDFVFIMKAVQKPILLSDGGIHNLTFDWFADIVKQGYNGGLFLERMMG